MLTELLSSLHEALPVIVSLIIIEGLLSVDNILAIAALASELPERQRKPAVRLGLIGAYLWRGIALLCAQWILRYGWLKLVGAIYLIHLLFLHFGEAALEGDENEESGHHRAGKTFWATVISIQFLDLSLSVDNVVAAVGLSNKFWVICIGVGLGLLALWVFATLGLRLISRFPILKHCAYLLVGYVGVLLIVEMTWHLQLGAFQKSIGIGVIVGLGLWYASSKWVRLVWSPVIRLCHPVFRFYGNLAVSVGRLLHPARK